MRFDPYAPTPDVQPSQQEAAERHLGELLARSRAWMRLVAVFFLLTVAVCAVAATRASTETVVDRRIAELAVELPPTAARLATLWSVVAAVSIPALLLAWPLFRSSRARGRFPADDEHRFFRMLGLTATAVLALLAVVLWKVLSAGS